MVGNFQGKNAYPVKESPVSLIMFTCNSTSGTGSSFPPAKSVIRINILSKQY